MTLGNKLGEGPAVEKVFCVSLRRGVGFACSVDDTGVRRS